MSPLWRIVSYATRKPNLVNCWKNILHKNTVYPLVPSNIPSKVPIYLLLHQIFNSRKVIESANILISIMFSDLFKYRKMGRTDEYWIL